MGDVHSTQSSVKQDDSALGICCAAVPMDNRTVLHTLKDARSKMVDLMLRVLIPEK